MKYMAVLLFVLISFVGFHNGAKAEGTIDINMNVFEEASDIVEAIDIYI